MTSDLCGQQLGEMNLLQLQLLLLRVPPLVLRHVGVDLRRQMDAQRPPRSRDEAPAASYQVEVFPGEVLIVCRRTQWDLLLRQLQG